MLKKKWCILLCKLIIHDAVSVLKLIIEPTNSRALGGPGSAEGNDEDSDDDIAPIPSDLSSSDIVREPMIAPEVQFLNAQPTDDDIFDALILTDDMRRS